jgi:hypothetical protein
MVLAIRQSAVPSLARWCLLAALPFLHPAVLKSQAIPSSQAGSVSQTVAFTEITVTYNRPVARGRVLFPDVVRWGRTWNPGADSATRIHFTRDVEVEGRAVRAGEYSIWMVPRETGPWVVILSRAAHVFHTPYPGEEHDALRIEVAPVRGAHMETLAFYFPEVNREEAVLRMHWGSLVLPLRIRATARPEG